MSADKDMRAKPAEYSDLYDAYIVQRLPLEKIAEAFGYSSDSKVKRRIRFLGISNRGLTGIGYKKKEGTVPYSFSLTDRQREICYGTLLGDSSLTKPRPNSYMQWSYAIASAPYVDWFKQELAPFSASSGTKAGRDGFTGKRHPAIWFKTYVHPEFTQMRRMFYPDGKKVVPIEALDKIGPLGLAVFYMDDGFYTRSQHSSGLCTQGFTLEGNLTLQRWLASSFGIQTALRNRPGGYGHYLWLGVEATKVLVSIVKPFIVPCMARKIGQS